MVDHKFIRSFDGIKDDKYISANGLYTVSYKLPSLMSTLSTIFMQACKYSAIRENDSPLDRFKQTTKVIFIRGVELPSLDRDAKWNFTPTVEVGAEVSAGDILGTVQETLVVEHRIMVPNKISGKVRSIAGR